MLLEKGHIWHDFSSSECSKYTFSYSDIDAWNGLCLSITHFRKLYKQFHLGISQKLVAFHFIIEPILVHHPLILFRLIKSFVWNANMFFIWTELKKNQNQKLLMWSGFLLNSFLSRPMFLFYSSILRENRHYPLVSIVGVIFPFHTECYQIPRGHEQKPNE